MRSEAEDVVPSVVPDEKTSKVSKEVAVVGMLASKPKLEVPELPPVLDEMEMVQTNGSQDAIIDKAKIAH